MTEGLEDTATLRPFDGERNLWRLKVDEQDTPGRIERCSRPLLTGEVFLVFIAQNRLNVLAGLLKLLPVYENRSECPAASSGVLYCALSLGNEFVLCLGPDEQDRAGCATHEPCGHTPSVAG